MNNKYVMLLTKCGALPIIEAEKEPLIGECGYQNWPNAMVKIKGNMDKFINKLSEYIKITYGNSVRDLKEVCFLYIDILENF